MSDPRIVPLPPNLASKLSKDVFEEFAAVGLEAEWTQDGYIKVTDPDTLEETLYDCSPQDSLEEQYEAAMSLNRALEDERRHRLSPEANSVLDKLAKKPSTYASVTVDRDHGISTEKVSAIADERTTNNAARHQYRILSDEEKAKMQAIKDAGQVLIDLIDDLYEWGDSMFAGEPAEVRLSCHEYDVAHDKAVEAVMWAVRGLTK